MNGEKTEAQAKWPAFTQGFHNGISLSYALHAAVPTILKTDF